MSIIRWGIIGTGDIVKKRVADAILDDPKSELVAACRRTESELKDFVATYKVSDYYLDAKDLIAADNIDAVYIATPVSTHSEFTQLAAEYGKHVLVEKPMAMSVQECDAMIQSCAKNQVNLGVAYYRRFYPIVQRIEALLKSGEIGKPLGISAMTATPMRMKTVAEGAWRGIPELGGGGSIMDIASHRINVFLHLMGEVSNVKSMIQSIHVDYEAENVASILMQFANGAIGTVQCFFETPRDPDEFTLIGTRGRVYVCPLNGGTLRIETEAGIRTETLPPANNFNSPLIADFSNAILTGQKSLITGEEGRWTNQIIEQAYQNAQQ